MTPRAFFEKTAARFRRAARNQSGATAVEFALIATPFFIMLFGILEVAMLFVATVALENAVDAASREIRIGDVQTGGGQALFEDTICDNIGPVLSCGDGLTFDVRTFEDFATAGDMANPIDADGEIDDDDFSFKPGKEREIVLVRVFYKWRIVTPLLGQFLSNLGGNQRLLTATVAFRNEPFGELGEE